MTLKSLNLSTTISQQGPDLPTQTPPIQSGVLTLSSSMQEKALARLVSPDTKVLQVTSMIEDGVSSLVQLEVKLNKDYEVKAYHIDRNSPLHKLHEAHELVLKSLVPLPISELDQRITAMTLLLTIPKDFSPKVLSAKRQALADKLKQYPADIVLDAIGYIERNVKFWPSLSEFINDGGIGWKSRPRFMLRDELQKCIAYQEAV